MLQIKFKFNKIEPKSVILMHFRCFKERGNSHAFSV